VGELEHVGHDPRRLVVLHGVPHELRVRSEEVDDLPGLRLADQISVDLGNILGQDDVGVLSLDRAETNVRVLNVRAVSAVHVASVTHRGRRDRSGSPSVSLERSHSLDVKGVVVNSATTRCQYSSVRAHSSELVDLPPGGHVLDLDGRLTDNITGVFGIFHLSVLFGVLGHLLVHAVLGLGENLVQELDGSLSGGHSHDETCES
jgi:hypothetical protein